MQTLGQGIPTLGQGTLGSEKPQRLWVWETMQVHGLGNHAGYGSEKQCRPWVWERSLRTAEEVECEHQATQQIEARHSTGVALLPHSSATKLGQEIETNQVF